MGMVGPIMDRVVGAGTLAVIFVCLALLLTVWRHDASMRRARAAEKDYLSLRLAVDDLARERALYEEYWPRYLDLRRRGVIHGVLPDILSGLEAIGGSPLVRDWRYSWRLDEPAMESGLSLWTARVSFGMDGLSSLPRIFDALGSMGVGLSRIRSCSLRRVQGLVQAECHIEGAVLSPTVDGEGDALLTTARHPF